MRFQFAMRIQYSAETNFYEKFGNWVYSEDSSKKGTHHLVYLFISPNDMYKFLLIIYHRKILVGMHSKYE